MYNNRINLAKRMLDEFGVTYLNIRTFDGMGVTGFEENTTTYTTEDQYSDMVIVIERE